MSGDLIVMEPLDRTHDRAAFSCGVEALDNYLKKIARQDQQRHIAKVHVLTEGPKIIGYYTLSSFAIKLTDLSDSDRKKLPKYGNLPAVLLGRLAVDSDDRGQGKRYGERLLIDALGRIVDANAQIAAYAVIVDAIDDNAGRFYEKYGFLRFPTIPGRLFLPLQTVVELFKL